MIGKIESVTPLDAKEVAVDPALITIVAANDFHACVGPANTQRGLAAIRAMRAGRADVFHLPRACLVAIRARGQRAYRTNINAHAALFAIEVVLPVRHDSRTGPAVLNSESPNVHSLTANANAAITQNAARAIKVHDWRPLLFIAMRLDINVFRLGGAVGERHVLQFALAAGIAYRTIKRMISEQHLDHALARLTNLIAVRGNNHAFGDARGAGGLQLRHLFDSHQAHAAGALQRKIRVVAKSRHLNAGGLAGFNQ